MTEFLGVSLPVFLGVTVVLFGAAAFKTGQALAATWRSRWHALPYCLLLAAGDRFMSHFLFDGVLLSMSGYLAAAAVLLAYCLAAYQMTLAHRMASQYPWLYRRHGLFGWRDKA
jgi:cell division protein FtsX